jgi:ferredoxin
MPSITHHRNKCIGCAICYEMMPNLWRMSTKDGKATLVNAILKNKVAVLSIGMHLTEESKKVALACPANIIKVNE